MYLLDTNVVAELRKVGAGKGDRQVGRWSASVPAARLFISVITLMELELGVLLIAGRDSSQGVLLRTWLVNRVMPAFAGRTLAIDDSVAIRCAELHVPDPRPERDALIAATALVHGLTVVTRNVGDFLPTTVPVMNPWDFP